MSRRKTTLEYIEEAEKVHKNKYDYSKTIYTSAHNKIIIICPIHGEFIISAYKHLQGQGCKYCGYESDRQKKMKTIEQCIEQANIVHNNKYDYSKFKYLGNKHKSTIICPIHGEFQQCFDKHINGKQGCPICKESHLEREMRNFLIENNIEFESQKRFKKLKMQSIDFYLPRYNIAIECQGRQHFEEVPFSSKNNDLLFEETIKRDIRKNKICKELGIDLIYYTIPNLLPSNVDFNNFSNGIYKKDKVFVHTEEIMTYIKSK